MTGLTAQHQQTRALAPLAKAQRARRGRRRRGHRPLRRVRAFARRARKGKPASVQLGCEITPPGAQDGITGWALYFCPTGVLMCPNGCCAPPECRGGKPGVKNVLGFQGDIGAGTGGSFLGGARSLGVTALDGVEIARGLAEVEGMRASGEIDRYYAGALKNAYLERLGPTPARLEPFKTPSPFGDFGFLAPGAVGHAFRGKVGPDVGGSVSEACRCTPREFDAHFAGWGVYYVPGGILLTPTKKCIGYYGRPLSFWSRMWRNIVRIGQEPEAVPDRLAPRPKPGEPGGPPAPTTAVKAAKSSYLCYDPRVTPPGYRPQAVPCEPPQIEWPGPY